MHTYNHIYSLSITVLRFFTIFTHANVSHAVHERIGRTGQGLVSPYGRIYT